MEKILVFVCGFICFAAGAAEISAIELKPIPMPQEMTVDWMKCVPLESIAIDSREGEADGWAKARVKEWYGEEAPKVSVAMTERMGKVEGEEGYILRADESGVVIKANTLAGVRNAMYTLRQIVLPKRGTLKTEGYIIPTCSIWDAPKLKFRGVHLCWFPEVRAERMERAIRLAALFKFNMVVLEMWGVFKSEVQAWRNWPEASVGKAEVRRLVQLGRELGVTIVPQFAVFGHAAMARSVSSKHCVLDLHPEYAPLYEPGGWNWCLTNPATQKVLREAIDELMEAFDHPPYIHLGCDEAQPPTCPECRKVDYAGLVSEHIAGLAKYVAGKGARAMMWHDMLLEQGDKRWEGYYANGDKATIQILEKLPRDIIICDWEYENGTNVCNKAWPTMRYLKEKGFDVVGCPWENMRAAQTMGAALSEMGALGLLQTTWHHLDGKNWTLMYRSGAAAAWGTPPPGDTPQCDSEFDRALRFVGHDMKIKSYRDTGLVEEQILYH